MFQKLSKEFLVNHLWILERKSGDCLFEHEFKSVTSHSQFPPDLISNFFMAFSRFIDEIYFDKIKKIKFQKQKFYFKVTEEHMFIVSTNLLKKSLESKIEDFFLKIIEKFYQTYPRKKEDKKKLSTILNFSDFINAIEELER